MSIVKKTWATLVGYITVGMLTLAHAGISVSDLRGTSGAGTKKVDDLTTSYTATTQKIMDFAFVIATLIGVFMFIGGIIAANKAQKDDRETPKPAIAAMVFGAMLTISGLVIGYFANTVAG